MLKKLWNDDAGVVTIEYLVLGTFLGLALIVGVHTLAGGINSELNELANAVQGFDQGFGASGFTGCNAYTDSSFVDDANGGADIIGTSAAASGNGNTSVNANACN